MPYVALRVLRVSGRRYLPGEIIEGNPHEWKGLTYLLSHGHIAGYPDSIVTGTSQAVDALRAEAKTLGIKGFGTMKYDTLVAKVAEAKAGNSDAGAGADGNSTGADVVTGGGQPDDPSNSPSGVIVEDVVNAPDQTATQPAGDDTTQSTTGGDSNVVDVLGGSNQQPEGSNPV